MTQKEYEEYYEEKLKMGKEGERYVYFILKEFYSIDLQPYEGAKAQYAGENAAGIEIKTSKYDKRKQFFLEVAEKALHSKAGSGWVSSGLYRLDNTKFMLFINLLDRDDPTYLIFEKKKMRDFCSSHKVKIIFKDTSQGTLIRPTSRGTIEVLWDNGIWEDTKIPCWESLGMFVGKNKDYFKKFEVVDLDW